MKNITTVLRELRSERRRTQEYMAIKLGISQSQYNKIEKGEKPLEMEMLSNIAKIFSIQPKQLFNAIYENENEKTIHKVFLGSGYEQQNEEEHSDDNYYKKMAHYFEKRFLKTYRMYIELSNKHNAIKIDESTQPITIAI